jgi:hypothetical protein
MTVPSGIEEGCTLVCVGKAIVSQNKSCIGYEQEANLVHVATHQLANTTRMGSSGMRKGRDTVQLFRSVKRQMQ